MWRNPVLCLLAAFACSAFAGEAPLVLQGTGAYHGLRVPLAVQSQARASDLSDLQVLNARGEPVPHAWVDEEPVAPDRREQNVPFFKAPAAASAVDAAQQGGWIIDLRAVKGALLELQLSVPPNEHGIYGFALEYGDDLQQWHTLVGAAQLLSLQHQGLRLEHTAFDLGGLRARYLRLRPLPGSTPPPLTGARVSSVTRYAPVAPLQWSEWLAPTQCSAQSCDYALPRHLPLERLEWQLADANTLAPVDLLVQYDNSETNTSGPTPWRHHHLLRDPLKSLRHKTAPAPTETANTWYPLQRTTAYWLRLPKGEVRSPELTLAGGLVTHLRVQPTGGMVQLGSKPPGIRIGARAVSLVFLAREPAPYRLAWGGETKASALTLAQLMPTRQAGDPLPTDTATVQLAAPAAPVAAASQASAAASTAPAAPLPSPKFWLWGVLLAALGLMGFMAWSLLRPAPKI
jgi:hypothetical protein